MGPVLIFLSLSLFPIISHGAILKARDFVGLDFRHLKAKYGINPHSCQFENRNSHKIKSLLEQSETHFFKKKRSYGKFQKAHQKFIKNFQKNLHQMDQRVFAFLEDNNDPMGIYSLMFLKERFELYASGIKKKWEIYKENIPFLPEEEEANGHLQRIHEILEGTRKVYLAIARCHQRDSLVRREKMKGPSQMGFKKNPQGKTPWG